METTHTFNYTDTPYGKIYWTMADILMTDKYGEITKVIIENETTVKFQKENGETPVIMNFKGNYNPIQIDADICQISDYCDEHICEPKFEVIRKNY